MSHQNLPSIENFERVLQNILSPDNNLRNQAEQHFNTAKQNPDYCVSSLLSILRNSKEVSIRSLCCILLRKCLTKTDDGLYNKLSDNVKGLVKQELVNALQHEPESQIRRKLVYCLSGVASGLIESGEFNELIPNMFNWCKPEAPFHLKESALGIFNQLATYLLEKGLAPYLTAFKQVFTSCLKDESGPVRLAALEATTSVVLVLDKQKRQAFADLIPLMLQVIGRALNGGDFTSATSCIESLIEIAVAQPFFFKNHVPAVITAMFQIASTANLPENTRHLGMEFMISLAEAAPSLVRKIDSFVQNIFPLCMNLMLDLEHDDDWLETYDDDDSELTNYDVGLESLDRLALSVGGKLVQPVAFQIIPTFLNNAQSWKHRHTGLMAISQTAEGCVKEYEAHLGTLVGMTLKLFKDQHPRVRYAAIHCTAQLCTDFSPIIQATFHSQIIPAMLGAMDDPVPKVQSHAATAIVNFVEDCENKYIQPYLDALLSKLLQLLRTGKRFVQEQSLSAISAVADCASTLFVKYYDHIMPFLKQILEKATGKQDRMLRARSIECVSLIGVAVGKEKFMNDAKEVMQLMMKTQQSELEPDDPQIHYLLQAWARIAKCLGQDFVPYLDYVMPSLLKSAELQPEVIVTDADEATNHDEEGMESVTLSIKGVGDKRISIRTSTLEEKALACSMLYSYVFELREGFWKCVEPVAKVMVPLLKFAYLEEIRETAANIMPELLKSVKIAAEKNMTDPSFVKKLLDYILGTLLDALKIEPEIRTATILVESLNDCIAVVGRDMLSNQQLEQIAQILMQVVYNSMMRKKELREEIGEHEEEEEKERIGEDEVLEEEFLTTTAEAIGGILKLYPMFVPHFLKYIWPIVGKMLAQELTDDDHRIALCIICDFVEYGKGAANNFFNDVYPTVLHYAVSDHPEVRQAAVYCIGAWAEFGGDVFKQACKQSIQQLVTAINRKDARTEIHAAATCNAVSALFKICKFQSNSDAVNKEQLLTIWLNALPVFGDNIEARIVHGHLVDLIMQNNPIILGQGNKNIPKIVHVFAEILNTERVNEDTQRKAVQIFKQLQSVIPAHLFQQVINSLSDKQKENLQKAVQQQ